MRKPIPQGKAKRQKLISSISCIPPRCTSFTLTKIYNKSGIVEIALKSFLLSLVRSCLRPGGHKRLALPYGSELNKTQASRISGSTFKPQLKSSDLLQVVVAGPLEKP